MRRFYDTTAPTKEGLLRDNKIVSNLQRRKINRGGYRKQAENVKAALQNVKAAPLGITGIRLYGAAGFQWRNLVSVWSAAVTT